MTIQQRRKSQEHCHGPQDSKGQLRLVCAFLKVPELDCLCVRLDSWDDLQVSEVLCPQSESSKSFCDSPLPSSTLTLISSKVNMLLIGPLRIYRAPGSVAFLNCSNALQPILPKSQCWEVDGSGKFVLQIRRPQYWRIEVPNVSRVEKIQVDELKEVLANVLLFEKTPCPFQRNFTVELPEAPQTPVKRRPWKPVERPRVDMTPLATSGQKENTGVAPATPESVSVSVMEQNSVSISPPITTYHSLTRDAVEAAFPSYHSDVDCCPDQSLSNGDNEPPPSRQAETGKTNDIQIQLEDNPPAGAVSDTAILSSPTSSGSEGCNQPGKASVEHLKQSASTTYPTEVIPEEDLPQPQLHNHLEDLMPEDDRGLGLEEESDFSDATDDTDTTPRSLLRPAFQKMTLAPDKETRPQVLHNYSRSITAPPVLSLVTSPPSKHRKLSPLRSSTVPESDSDLSSSVDSFHSVQSWHSPLAPPSPHSSGSTSPTSKFPYPHENIVLPKRQNHLRDASELTVTPETPRVWEMSVIADVDTDSRSLSSPPRTPTLVDEGSEKSDEEQFEVTTPSVTRPSIRHRATTSSNSRRRTLSPLPAAVNLFSPPRRRNRGLQTARHLPTAIIQKTCEILLSPPSHLLQLMLNIASKIAAGEWRGVLSGHGEAVHWDFEDEYSGEGWHEDDYGISLAKTSSSSKTRNHRGPGGSWEID